MKTVWEKLSRLDKERWAMKALRGLIIRHFYFSHRERGSNSHRDLSWFIWQVNDGRLRLQFPAEIKTAERRAWLEENILDPNPSHPGEQSRIQSRIDEHFGNGFCIRSRAPQKSVPSSVEPSQDSALHQFLPQDLAETVAEEKTQKYSLAITAYASCVPLW